MKRQSFSGDDDKNSSQPDETPVTDSSRQKTFEFEECDFIRIYEFDDVGPIRLDLPHMMN